MLVFRETIGSHQASLDRGWEDDDSSVSLGLQSSVLKLTVPTPFGWYFFNVRFGRERRSIDRLVDDGQLSLMKLSIAYTLAMWLLIGFVCLGIMVGIYLVKSFAGIDLFRGASFLHNFIY